MWGLARAIPVDSSFLEWAAFLLPGSTTVMWKEPSKPYLAGVNWRPRCCPMNPTPRLSPSSSHTVNPTPHLMPPTL